MLNIFLNEVSSSLSAKYSLEKFNVPSSRNQYLFPACLIYYLRKSHIFRTVLNLYFSLEKKRKERLLASRFGKHEFKTRGR